MPQILVFNQNKYASLKSRDTHKELPADFNGFYATAKNGINLYRPNGTFDAFIVNNARQGQFVVSVGLTGTGTPFYLHAMCSLTESWLGLSGASGTATREAIEGIAFEPLTAEHKDGACP